MEELQENIPFKYVPISTYHDLAILLDQEPSVAKCNNWKGLADKLDYPTMEILSIEAKVTLNGSRTYLLFADYVKKHDSTVNKVLEALQQLERIDAVDVLLAALPDIRRKQSVSPNKKRNGVEHNLLLNSPIENEYLGSSFSPGTMVSQDGFVWQRLPSSPPSLPRIGQPQLAQFAAPPNAFDHHHYTHTIRRSESDPWNSQRVRDLDLGGHAHQLSRQISSPERAQISLSGGSMHINHTQTNRHHLSPPIVKPTGSQNKQYNQHFLTDITRPLKNNNKLHDRNEIEMEVCNSEVTASGSMSYPTYGSMSDPSSMDVAAEEEVHTSPPSISFQQTTYNSSYGVKEPLLPSSIINHCTVAETSRPSSCPMPSGDLSNSLVPAMDYMNDEELINVIHQMSDNGSNILSEQVCVSSLDTDKLASIHNHTPGVGSSSSSQEGTPNVSYPAARTKVNEQIDLPFSHTYPSTNKKQRIGIPKPLVGLQQNSNDFGYKAVSEPKNICPVKFEKAARDTRVFITYASDSGEHLNSILAAANNLRKNGFAVSLDMYEKEFINTPQDRDQWLLRRYSDANFILVCISPQYYEDVLFQPSLNFHDRSLHGRYIYQLMEREYQQLDNQSRFICLLFSNATNQHIPPLLCNVSKYRWPAEYKNLFFKLMRPERLLSNADSLPQRPRSTSPRPCSTSYSVGSANSSGVINPVIISKNR